MNANGTAGSWLLNPDSPYAWLPPSLATQFEASGLLATAILGAWTWDVLIALPEECRLLFKNRFTLAQAAYILARISSLLYIYLSTIYQVAPIPNCDAIQTALGWSAAVAVPSNAFLFFTRIRAVFFENKPAVVFFGCLWVSTFVSISVPFAILGNHIGDTQRCINTGTKRFSSVALIVSTVHDTAVFVAITWRLLWFNIAETTWSGRLRAFASGDGLGSISKALLQSGQAYYFLTVGMNLLNVVMILEPAGPPMIHALFTIPNIALTNSMACRVYRNLKLGIIEEHPALTDHTISSVRFQAVSRRTSAKPGQSVELHTVELHTVDIHSPPTDDSLGGSTKQGSMTMNIPKASESDVRLDFGKPAEVV